MNCPDCNQPLPESKTDCPACSASRNRSRFETALQQGLASIESADFVTALEFLNQAILLAPSERLAECYSARGFAQLKHLDFVRAEEDCTEAISLNWQQAQTFAWRAASRGEQNKWRLAFDDLDQACELAGPLRDQYLGLMDSYAQTASEYFREQITAGNRSADIFFERGWIYLRSGKYLKAERDFQHAIQKEEQHPWAAVGLAELLLHQHETAGVRELCETALFGDTACCKRALQIRAELNFKNGDHTATKNDLDQLSKLCADEPHELVACAQLRARLGDPVAAIDQLNFVLTDAPELRLALLVRGDCFHEIRNYGLAIQDYSSYLTVFPQAVPALVRRAKMYLAVKRYAAATTDLRKAIELDATDFDAQLVLSEVHLAEERLDEALNQCRLAVSLDNQQAHGFAVLASIYNRLCDYGNAIEEYSRSIELSKTTDDKAQYHFLRGIAYYELGDVEKSLVDFKRATHNRPHHAGSWIWKSAAYARAERWAEAINGLQTAMLVRPSSAEQYQKLGQPIAEKAIEFYNRQQQRGDEKADLFRHRGLAQQFLGQDEEAIRDYTIALKKEPNELDTLLRRGQSLVRLGNTTAAIKDFSHVLSKDSKNHRAHYNRAIASLADGNLSAAKFDLQSAIKTAPEHPRYHLLLGELMLKLDKRPQAINCFDRAIVQDPSNPAAYRVRGLAQMSANRNLRAIHDFTRSLELNPHQLDLMVIRGETYLKIDQPLMAIEDFELALTHNEKLAKAYSGRAMVLVTQNRHEYALIWLTKAIHRFTDPFDLAEILFARGKVFYQMGRSAPAIIDFTDVMELVRDDRATVAAARYARAIAEIHVGNFEYAARDFRKLILVNPDNLHFQSANKWLNDRSQPIPAFLAPPETTQRPTRPPVIRKGVTLSEKTTKQWKSESPYDGWIVRTAEKKEYGPVPLMLLDNWAKEGRLDVGMKLLRSDWPKWKRIEKILTEITPLESFAATIDTFPDLNTRPR